ncbi:MAG: aspartyl/glutamyl-tRNA amidotransferase subunit C [Methanomassiliicoccales archaeon]
MKETLEEVARQARLALTQEEIEEFAADLEEILEYFSVLDEAPSHERWRFNSIPVEDITREDEPLLEIDPSELRDLMGTYQDWVRGPRLS